MKFVAGPNFKPAVLVLGALAALGILLLHDLGKRDVPAREEMGFLAPGGWLYVGSSSIEQLWRGLDAQRQRTTYEKDDWFKKKIQGVVDGLGQQCLWIPDAESLRDVGIDSNRGVAGALYGLPFDFSDFEHASWLVAVPLRDPEVFLQALLAATAPSKILVLRSMGLPPGGRIVVTSARAGRNYRLCDMAGKALDPRVGNPAPGGQLSARLVSTLKKSQDLVLTCKGVDARGHDFACGCVDPDNANAKPGTCHVSLGASDFTAGSLDVAGKKFVAIRPGAADSERDHSPLIIVTDRVSLVAANEKIAGQALKGLVSNADVLGGDSALTLSPTLVVSRRGGWIAGALRMPSPPGIGGASFAASVDGLAVDFRAQAAVEISDMAVIKRFLASKSADVPPLPAGSMATLSSDSGLIGIWSYVSNWLPDLHTRLKDKLGNFVPILDSLNEQRIKSIRFVMLEFRGGVPEVAVGLRMQKQAANDMILGLQRSMRVNRDSQVLLGALGPIDEKGPPAPQAVSLPALVGKLEAEQGALWTQYRYVQGSCKGGNNGKDTGRGTGNKCENTRFEASLPPGAFAEPQYRFLVAGQLGQYITPPVTENDFRFGAYAGNKEQVDLDKGGLEQGLYRMGAVYLADTLWFGTDRHAVGALVSGLDVKALPDVCGKTEGPDENSRISLCLAPDLLSNTQDKKPVGTAAQDKNLPLAVRIRSAFQDQRWIASHYRRLLLNVSGGSDHATITVEGHVE